VSLREPWPCQGSLNRAAIFLMWMWDLDADFPGPNKEATIGLPVDIEGSIPYSRASKIVRQRIMLRMKNSIYVSRNHHQQLHSRNRAGVDPSHDANRYGWRLVDVSKEGYKAE
jgi:hypothetical protein